MPSKSQAQARMMASAAHNPKFAKKVGVPQSVAKEFNKADTGKNTKALPKHVSRETDAPNHTILHKNKRSHVRYG